MGLFQTLSIVALRQLADGAGNAVGVQGGAGDAVAKFLTQRFTDHSQHLTAALGRANDRAWKAMEIALAGESFWDRCKVRLASAEDQAFRQQVRAFLDTSNLKHVSANQGPFCQQCLVELRGLRGQALLTTGQLAPAELARETVVFARFGDPQRVLDAEWAVMERAAAEVQRAGCPNLARLLRSRPKHGASILAVGVRYFFRREVETDAELFQGLAFAKLESLHDAQAVGFKGLHEALAAQGQRLEEMLADLGRVAGETLRVSQDTKALVQGLAQQVQTLVVQFQLQDRPVRRSDSLSIRNEGERQLVKQLVGQYRALAEEDRRRLPALLNDLAKLQVVAGEFEAAQQDFQEVAKTATDAKAGAEAYHNAYHAALEQRRWDDALAAVREAARLDPGRFAPFPLDRYEPQRILGAGGFGVVYLCRHRHIGTPLVIKTLLTTELDRAVTDVFAEARRLEELDHPAIMRLRDCDYADGAGTRPYLVMDYFNGVSLDQYVMEDGLLAPDDLLAVATQIAEALQAAHHRNILHRDVKPQNVLVRRDEDGLRVKLIDFGLALRGDVVQAKASTAGPQARTSTEKSVAGTLYYAAPEQMGLLPGAAVGPHSDVYGFGKTCYYALLRTPDPDDMEKEELPDGWRRLLARCTGRKLENRLPDFGAVLRELHGLAPGNRRTEPRPIKLPPTRATHTSDILYLKGKGVVARGRETPNGFLVLAGSQAVKEAARSAPPYLVEMRARLAQEGELVAGPKYFRLRKDFSFDSPSMAAGVMLGRAANGRIEWQDEQGRALKELQAMRGPMPSNPAVAIPEKGTGTDVSPDDPLPTRQREKSDQPAFVAWGDEPEGAKDVVSTWKEVLVVATARALALGLAPEQLPMPRSPTGDGLRSPGQVRPGLFVEAHGSAKLIRARVSAMLAALGKRGGFLRVETRSGNTLELPE